MFGGKRKVFNSKAARVEGTEAAAYNNRPTAKGAAGNRLTGHPGEGISSKTEGPLPTWKAQVRSGGKLDVVLGIFGFADW